MIPPPCSTRLGWRENNMHGEREPQRQQQTGHPRDDALILNQKHWAEKDIPRWLTRLVIGTYCNTRTARSGVYQTSLYMRSVVTLSLVNWPSGKEKNSFSCMRGFAHRIARFSYIFHSQLFVFWGGGVLHISQQRDAISRRECNGGVLAIKR